MVQNQIQSVDQIDPRCGWRENLQELKVNYDPHPRAWKNRTHPWHEFDVSNFQLQKRSSCQTLAFYASDVLPELKKTQLRIWICLQYETQDCTSTSQKFGLQLCNFCYIGCTDTLQIVDVFEILLHSLSNVVDYLESHYSQSYG